MWLLKKRIIALAELIGLPRVSAATVSAQEQEQSAAFSSITDVQKQKDQLWESICTVDRITSLMVSLPLATANYPLPKRPVVNYHGQVNPQSYLYSLADIASRVLELDNIYSSGKPLTELYNAVMSTDQDIRSLASRPPNTWRRMHWSELSIDAILQYWHQYLTVRTHLQLALKYYEGQEFSFNFITCLDASQELVKRYASVRPILPAGFFANRVIDLQAFTATVFLLLASYRNTRGSGMSLLTVDVNVTSSLVDQAVQIMGFAADRAGGDFARQAVDAIRSLNSLLQQPQTLESQTITLNLALVGKIHVSRKSSSTKTIPNQPYLAHTQLPHIPWQAPVIDGAGPAAPVMPFRPSDPDLMSSLSYSMEVQDPFLTDEPFGAEQWLTWTGLES